jgi:hypothetical protein
MIEINGSVLGGQKMTIKIKQGAKSLGFFSSGSLKTREIY